MLEQLQQVKANQDEVAQQLAQADQKKELVAELRALWASATINDVKAKKAKHKGK